MGLGTFKMWQKYKNSTGLIKSQLGYFLIAILFSLIGAFPFNIILPLFGNYQLIFIGPFFITAMIIVMFYAIIKHRLFDIKFALQQIVVYLVNITLTAVFLMLITLIYTSYISSPMNPDIVILILATSVIIVIAFEKLQSLSRLIAKKFFFQSIYDYQETLLNLSQNLSKILEMPKLVDTIIDTLLQTMRLSRVAVLVRDYEDYHFKIQKTIGFNQDNGIALVKDNFLTSYLEEHPKIIILEEIKKLSQEETGDIAKKAFCEIASHMEHIEAELIVPIVNAGKMISLIVLGNKTSGDPYTVQDINLLTTIASQASIAIENARLYKEIQEFNTHLEEKVKQATGEIQARNKQLEKANIQIGLAQKVKNDLLTMASHEFRTPTSIINNALWYLNKDEVKAKLSEKEKQNIERIAATLERLNYVVDNINQMLLTTSGEFEIQVEPVQTEIIIKNVVDDKLAEATDKHVKLEFIESDKLLPEINADKVKLKYVIWELVTNALKYTGENGKISIQTKTDGNDLNIIISDTGRGIPQDKLPTLFEGFGKIDIMHTTQPGMGLGLYIIKRIIDLHKGKIEVTSKEGTGTTFTISLPVKNLSDIKPDNNILNHDIPNYETKMITPQNYESAGKDELPHPFQALKCIMGFQLIIRSLLYRHIA